MTNVAFGRIERVTQACIIYFIITALQIIEGDKCFTSRQTMELIVREHLVDHMMINKLFFDAHDGFLPGRSCMTQLLVVIELWTEMLDSGDPVDAIYLDFRKAFDTLPHQRLLNKLKAYGIVGDINDWIRALLTRHTHRVIVNSSLSSLLEVLSGISQGSVLGQILFLLFINDLTNLC